MLLLLFRGIASNGGDPPPCEPAHHNARPEPAQRKEKAVNLGTGSGPFDEDEKKNCAKRSRVTNQFEIYPNLLFDWAR